MKILTCVSYPDDLLEEYRPRGVACGWELVVSGGWSEDKYHSGYVSYYLANSQKGVWVMDGVYRSAELDGVTEEDLEEGRLGDDQMQAAWGITLEEAQNKTHARIVAVCLEAPPDAGATEIAKALYKAVLDAGGKAIDEPDGSGLLSS